MNKRYTLVFLLLIFLHSHAKSQQTVGLFSRTTESENGYVLFNSLYSKTTYLIDKCGKEIHSWHSNYTPGASVYLLPDGTLLRTGNIMTNAIFNSPGCGGVIEKLDWNSNVTWSYILSDSLQCQHHDICALPNGNILAIAWELKTNVQAIANGRDPSTLSTSLWCEKIVEIQPTGTNSGNIIWEWHVWDHLIQDFDNNKPNYGVISQHPELINFNYHPTGNVNPDWLHINAICYNPILDQIMVSVHNTSELWIIDHSTTTTEAASHSGGIHNKGGDLLYRWGNPAAYDRGTIANQQLFLQHNPHWIAGGLEDSGKILIFNNGNGRTGGNYSSVDMITPPITPNGDYTINGNHSYLPDTSTIVYKAPNPSDFYAMNISSAQRLPGGNTLICEGPVGRFFEIDSAKNIVWEYINPVNSMGPINQGTPPIQNLTFRCKQLPINYSGFMNETLISGNPIELNPLSYNCTMIIPNSISSTSQKNNQIKIINPFSQQIEFFATNYLTNATVTLYQITGGKIADWKINITEGKNILPLQKIIASGCYILEIRTNKFCQRMKIIAE